MKIRVCAPACVVNAGSTSKTPRLFAIEYFNENISITFVFLFLFGNVLLINPGILRSVTL